MCAGDRYRAHSRLKFDRQGSAIFSDRLYSIQWTYSRLHPVQCGRSSSRQSGHLGWDWASSHSDGDFDGVSADADSFVPHSHTIVIGHNPQKDLLFQPYCRQVIN